MLLSEAIQQFVLYLDSLERSWATIRGYAIELNCLLRYLEEKYNGQVYLEDLTVKDLDEYLIYVKTHKGYLPNSRKRLIYIIRSFYNFAVKKDLVSVNLGQKLEPVSVPQRERAYLSKAEFEELLEAIDYPLIKVVIQTLYLTGLRIGEALSLTLDDVDLTEKIIYVRKGKGKKERLIPICDRLYKVLCHYVRELRPQVDSNKFFATKTTGSLSAVSVNRYLHRAVRQLGWDKKVTCHVLRHSFASNLVKHNVNLVHLQKLLGHASLKTTSVYTHSNLEDLKDAVNVLN